MTAYENLWSEFKIPAYPIELKMDKVEKLGQHCNMEDWYKLGPALVRSIASACRQVLHPFIFP